MKRIIVHLFQIIILYILGSGYSNPSHLPIKENNLERIKSEKCELEWFSGSWTALGTGLNSTALSVAVDNNDHVYAGGFFTSKIRKWDGTSWTVPGFTGLNGDCQVIKVDKTNNLIYAGGNFTSASGTPASRIARWNGTNWSALGSGLNFDCYAIAIDNSGNVYAGGAFLQAGGTTVNYIAKWDGTSWTALGSGLNDICRSIAVDDMGNVYAGGQFTQAGGVLVNYIAKWDGTSWSALGSGFNFWCYSIDINSNGDIYAGGGFTTAGGNGASRIAMWDGSQWSALSSGLNGQCQTIKCHLDGSIFVGGTFTAAGGNTANRIAKWDGLQWSPLGTGLSSTCFGVDLDGSGNLFAAGIFTTAGGISANRIAQWDGTILPVEWLSFKGVHSDQNVQLFWQTTSEHSNLGYQVQHSSDGEKWRNIGFVEGKGYTSGIENYYFIHKGPHLKDNYYRLKQIDFNGNSNYSKIINITVNLNSEIKIFPNPTNNNIKIYDVNYNSFIIVLYDIYGRKILEKEFNNNENELDLSLTAHGLYYVKIVVNDDIIHNSTIIKN